MKNFSSCEGLRPSSSLVGVGCDYAHRVDVPMLHVLFAALAPHDDSVVGFGADVIVVRRSQAPARPIAQGEGLRGAPPPPFFDLVGGALFSDRP